MKIEIEELSKIIAEEIQAVILEGDDRCTRIAKRKYDVWPSAYASGAVVKCRQGKIWKDLKEDEISDDEKEELEKIEKELAGASKMHKSQSDRIDKITKEETRDTYGSEVVDRNKKSLKKSLALEEEEEGLRKWFGRKGEPGSKGGWVDCNAPKYKDGKKVGYKACGRQKGEKRSKYPACRPTAAQCKSGGKGKKWGKKSGSKK